MKIFLSLTVFAFLIALSACRSSGSNGNGNRKHSSASAAEITAEHSSALTPAQEKWLKKYERFRGRIFNYFGLSDGATWEDARPHLAKALGFSTGATWEEMLRSPTITNELTEGKRRDIARDFGLGDDATWFKIKDTLDSAKFRRRR